MTKEKLIYEYQILASICIINRLQTLKDEYLRRLQLYQQQLAFLQYFSKHPGLEHKAGVPKGGTFVLVYHAQQTETNTLNVAKTNQLTVDLSSQNTIETANFTTFNTEQIERIRTFINDCSSAQSEAKQKILKILPINPVLVPSYQITDSIVIADFYIPYLCCSDCAPVAYIVPQQEQTKPTIPMKTGFCSDEKAVSITPKPTDSKGQITDTENKLTKAISGSAGSFSFTPGLVFDKPSNKAKYLNDPLTTSGKLVYQLSSGIKSDPIVVTVFRHPLPDFTHKLITGRVLRRQTTSLDLQAEEVNTNFEYEWVVKFSNEDDNKNIAQIPLNVPHLTLPFISSLTVSVSLTVINKLAGKVNIICKSMSNLQKIMLRRSTPGK
ncbi:MAG: hypothetical protein ABSE72_04005 [Bacteroidales bacterium]